MKPPSERVVRNVARMLLCAVVEQVEDQAVYSVHSVDIFYVALLFQQTGRTVRDVHDLRRDGARDAFGALAMMPLPNSIAIHAAERMESRTYGNRETYILNDDWARVAKRALQLYSKCCDVVLDVEHYGSRQLSEMLRAEIMKLDRT